MKFSQKNIKSLLTEMPVAFKICMYNFADKT